MEISKVESRDVFEPREQVLSVMKRDDVAGRSSCMTGEVELSGARVNKKGRPDTVMMGVVIGAAVDEEDDAIGLVAEMGDIGD